MNDGFGGPTLDELIDRQPAEVANAIRKVIQHAGTEDCDSWDILLAAGQLIAKAANDCNPEFVSTDALVDELLGRFEHVVFCGLRILTDNETTIVRRWKGNAITCAGLGTEVGHAVLADLEQRSERKPTP